MTCTIVLNKKNTNFQTKTTCPNKNNGCCLSFKLADIEFHLKECPYSDLNCPLDTFVEDCRWRGKTHEYILDLYMYFINLGAYIQAVSWTAVGGDGTERFLTALPNKNCQKRW